MNDRSAKFLKEWKDEKTRLTIVIDSIEPIIGLS